MRGVFRGPQFCSVALIVLLTPAFAVAAIDLEIPRRLMLTGVNVAIFAALVWPTNRFVIQPLLQVLREREQASEGTLGRVAELLEDSAARRETLEERLEQARAAAQARRTAIMTEAESEERRVIGAAREAGANALERVRAEVVAELGQARSAFEAEASGLAQAAAVKILGREL